MFTVYKTTTEHGAYVKTTAEPLNTIEGNPEHIADIEGDAVAELLAVCFCLKQMEQVNFVNDEHHMYGILNYSEMTKCDASMLSVVGLCTVEFQELTQHTVDWMVNRYNATKPIPIVRKVVKAKCDMCGFECDKKNMKRHTGSRQCTKRQQPKTEQIAEQKEKHAEDHARRLEAQRETTPCNICGKIVIKRNMKRHQATKKCQPCNN